MTPTQQIKKWTPVIVLIVLTAWSMNGLAQQGRFYYQHLTKGQLAFAKGNYKAASNAYLKAFTYHQPFSYDSYIAMQIELNYAGARKKALKQLISYAGGKGKQVSGEAYLEMMSRFYPGFEKLPYVNELVETYLNTQPVITGSSPHEAVFKQLYEKDQSIRETAIKALGGQDPQEERIIGLTKEPNIYTSKFADSITSVDEQNMDALLDLLNDKTLSEQSCYECFNDLEIIVIHNMARGNSQWIIPLKNLVEEGRMDVRRFVRLLKRYSGYSDMNIAELKKQGLYYGETNCIRLYTIMYYTRYRGTEREEVDRNRQKIGYPTIDEEIEIKTWQFRQNDMLRFYPFDALLFTDGSEDETMKAALLAEQEKLLQQAKDGMQAQQLGELMVVEK